MVIDMVKTKIITKQSQKMKSLANSIGDITDSEISQAEDMEDISADLLGKELSTDIKIHYIKRGILNRIKTKMVGVFHGR